MLDTILRALRDEPGYWWHTYRMAWKQNWRESLLPGAGAGFCLGLWAFLLYALPDLENVPISVWICMVLGIFFCWCSACICLRRWFWSACPRRSG